MKTIIKNLNEASGTINKKIQYKLGISLKMKKQNTNERKSEEEKK